MTIGTVGQSLWQSATTALANPQGQTVNFNVGTGKPANGNSGSPAPQDAGSPSEILNNDLQTWMLAQQTPGTSATTPAQARAAYEGTSALLAGTS